MVGYEPTLPLPANQPKQHVTSQGIAQIGLTLDYRATAPARIVILLLNMEEKKGLVHIVKKLTLNIID